ncbi:MAG: type II toxin-antitoxin system Phd/YefM family antitoxin [Alphaproteobacteria bacterium]|nr:type II toxin-antitoxin system Phd/YefM family antitoxin [Alphaproteobacteria bacterium]
MTALIERSDQAISITEVVRSTKSIINKLISGEQNHYVIMKNNSPAAVLLNIQAYEELLDELEDLRIEDVARKRLQRFDKSTALSHEDMMQKFKLDHS